MEGSEGWAGGYLINVFVGKKQLLCWLGWWLAGVVIRDLVECCRVLLCCWSWLLLSCWLWLVVLVLLLVVCEVYLIVLLVFVLLVVVIVGRDGWLVVMWLVVVGVGWFDGVVIGRCWWSFVNVHSQRH